MIESRKLYFDTEKEWLEFKDGKIGASTIGAVAGLNKKQTPLEVWKRMTNRVPPLIQTEKMIFGVYGEDTVRKMFKHYYPETVFLRDLDKILVYQSVEYPFLQSTPDDQVVFEGEEMNCEIKTTDFYWLPEEVPSYIIAQCHFQMYLSGHKKTLLIWVNVMDRSLHYDVIELDEEQAVLMTQAAIEFIELVKDDIPPNPVTFDDWKETAPTEDSIEANDEVINYLHLLSSVNVQLKNLEEKKNYLKLKIANFMDEHEVIMSNNGTRLVSFKEQSRTTISKELIVNDGLVDKYSKTTTSRVMRPNYRKIDEL